MRCQALLAEDPVDRRLRGQVDAAVSEDRDDLFGREVAKLGRCHEPEDLAALALAQLVGRFTPRPRTAVIANAGLTPALDSPYVNPDQSCGAFLACTAGDGFVDPVENQASLLSGVPSPSSPKRSLTFFDNVRSAVTSARALSFSWISRSSSRIR